MRRLTVLDVPPVIDTTPELGCLVRYICSRYRGYNLTQTQQFFIP